MKKYCPKYAKNSDQKMGDLHSPYDLNRRSGQRLIWQALASSSNTTMTRAELQEKVAKAYRAEFPEYYNAKYTNDAPFDSWTTVIVMNRAPFNAKIEALKQRVEVDTIAETVMLMTDVAEPRVAKKRGRKKGTKNQPKIEMDIDSSTEIGVDEPTIATV